VATTGAKPHVPPRDISDALLRNAYDTAQAAGYGVSPEQWRSILLAILGSAPTEVVPQEFIPNLRLEELALARGCAAGNEKAWEVFLTRFREKLYAAALSITRNDVHGRELADSIYATLYASGGKDGERKSRLESYSGRGSLEGWLRTVLAQEWVNSHRKGRRTVSLDEQIEAGAQFAEEAVQAEVPLHPMLVHAIDESLSALEAEDRYVLASYFLDQRTLKQIAASLGSHESTMSRRVEKLTRGLNKDIRKRLMRLGMDRRQAEEALQTDYREIALDIRSRLSQPRARAALPPEEYAQEGKKPAF
jgi:RNA polymerase sigma-70 factor (ECF subfamily)